MRKKKIGLILLTVAMVWMTGCNLQWGEYTSLEERDSTGAGQSVEETFGQDMEDEPVSGQDMEDESVSAQDMESEPASTSEVGGDGEESVKMEQEETVLQQEDEESSVSSGSSIEAVIGTLAEATGYSWSDVYIVIMNTVLTKPDGHTGVPSFALLPWNDREEPVLVVGYWQDPVAQDYTIYSFLGDTLIEVEHMSGELFISSKDRQILCKKPDGTQEMYQYGGDHLVKLAAGTYSTEGFEPLAFTSLKDQTITDENIREYIQ